MSIKQKIGGHNFFAHAIFRRFTPNDTENMTVSLSFIAVSRPLIWSRHNMFVIILTIRDFTWKHKLRYKRGHDDVCTMLVAIRFDP